MAMTIDHLRAEHVIHVLKAFTDARGVSHAVGEQGLITEIGYDWKTREISLAWKRGETVETMVFAEQTKTGPGNGRMKEYFELGEYQPAPPDGKRYVQNFGYVPIKPEVPEVTPHLITSTDQFDEAMQRVWALAAHRRFDEAKEQLFTMLNATTNGVGHYTDEVADTVCGFARIHAFDEDRTVYNWLRDLGLNLWYTWGSGATSGGDGMARSVDIRKAENDFKEIERKLGINA